jgi:cytochrome c
VGSTRRGVLPTALVAVLALVTLTACDARVREIRSRLDDRQRVLFDRGQQVAVPCWSCHDLHGTQHKIGPHLSGLFGRRSGATDFHGYSPALRDGRITWETRTLDAFLADPQRFAPGTTMLSPGVPSPADRAALLFYLEQVTSIR